MGAVTDVRDGHDERYCRSAARLSLVLAACLATAATTATPNPTTATPNPDDDELKSALREVELAARQAEARPRPFEVPARPNSPDERPLGPTPSIYAAAEGRRDLTDHVDFAIRSGVRFLYSMQLPDGSFSAGRFSQQPGATALVVLALLSCGEARTRPEVRAAVEWLRGREITSTYSLALRAAVLSQFGGAARDPLLRRDVQRLIGMVIDDGPERGLYTYGQPGAGARADLSNAQYGVLGVWYAAEAGIEVPRGYWQRIEAGWTRAQRDDGGFGYRIGDNAPSRGSMTAAGIATLLVTHDFLHAGSAAIRPPTAVARESQSLQAAERALTWLNTYFRVDAHPGLGAPLVPTWRGVPEQPNTLFDRTIDTHLHYMLFSYERVAEATGLTRFAGRRWYEEGVRQLIATQAPDGSWPDGTYSPAIDTAFALLFLARGRAPVVVQKLRFEGRWNNRSRDAASVVRWLRRETERHVNWQLAGLDQPFDDLREAPILYLASDEALRLPESQWHLIKRYLDEGGLLLAADESGRPGGGPLTDSIKALFARLYPSYTFREAPRDHPFLSGNFPTSALDAPVFLLGNGIRELAVLLPAGDFPGRWQRTLGTASGKTPEFSLIGNVLVHVTGRANLRYRGVYHYLAPPGPNGDQTARLPPWTVAQVVYVGNWQPEPLAWEHVGNRLSAESVARLSVDHFTPAELGSNPSPVPLAHLVATHVPLLTSADREGLARYLRRGGRLLLEAAGGDPDVALWAEQLLPALLPGGQWRRLPPEHPVYRRLAGPGGLALFRPAAAERVGGRQAPPRLLGYYVGPDAVAILAGEDLSSGLVGYPHDGIIGYSPDTARALATGLLEWANNPETRRAVPPPPPPASSPADPRRPSSRPGDSPPR